MAQQPGFLLPGHILQYGYFQTRTFKAILYFVIILTAVEEAQLIRLAMFRVMSDLQMCVSFLEVAPTAPQFKVKITPTKADKYDSSWL
jgi:hypothetical protein